MERKNDEALIVANDGGLSEAGETPNEVDSSSAEETFGKSEYGITEAQAQTDRGGVSGKRILGWTMLGAAALMIGGLVLGALSSSPFEAAAEACELSSLLLVHDDGDSLSIRGGGEEASLHDVQDITCILREVEVPAYVVDHIASTRALDGQQTAEWDGITARWTYHPEPGLSLSLVRK